MSAIGINFRATAGYIADSAGQTYSLGEVYPTTRAGWTFGWSVSSTANSRDRLTNYGATVAGVVFVANGGSTRDFTLDLLDGPGTYRVRIAMGDGTNVQSNQRIVIKDGSAGSALATITGTMSTVGTWFDATGVERVAGAWNTDNVAIDLAFTGSQLVATVGNTGSGASALAHIYAERLGGDATAPTLSSPSGTGGVGVCSGSVSTNEGNGTLYAVVTSSATAPTAAQVKAGQDNAGAAALRAISQAVSATGTQSIASGAVSAGTRYMYFMHEDAATNQSTVVGSASFTVTSGGDTTAPVLSSPTGVQTGSTTATVGATTDEGNGTMYAVVTTSATQPSVAQIKAGQNNAGTAAAWSGSVSVSSTGAKTLAATGLTASTAYYAHLVHTDATGNDSNRVSSSSFTTAAPTRTITLTLTAADGTTPRANLTGLKWAVWDVATPDLIAAAPAAKGAAETTDASGVLVITYTSSLSVGGTAYLVVTDSNGDPAQSPAPKAFAGPVMVS